MANQTPALPEGDIEVGRLEDGNKVMVRVKTYKGTDMLRMWTEADAIQGWSRVNIPEDQVADFWAEMEALAVGK